MRPSKQHIDDVDLLDIVRRLRQYINSLDNTHFLITKLNQFGDAALTNMSERIAVDIDNVAASAANLLKHIENCDAYMALVHKYRPSQHHEEPSKDKADEFNSEAEDEVPL